MIKKSQNYLGVETRMLNETYSEEIVNRVWSEAKIIKGVNSDRFRIDECGALITRFSYGKESEFGWQIFRSEFNTKMTNEGKRVVALHWENFSHRVRGDNECHILAQPILLN